MGEGVIYNFNRPVIIYSVSIVTRFRQINEEV